MTDQQPRHLVYVGTEIPQQGYGARVVVYRHLARLRDCTISVIHTDALLPKLDTPQSEWHYISRPQPRLWGPDLWGRFPETYALSARLAAWYYAGRLVARPNAILNLFGVNSLEACALARHFKVPLLLFVHDRWQVWTKPLFERRLMQRGRAGLVLRHAARIWTVSPELAAVYALHDERVRVLFPIPEDNQDNFAQWREAFQFPTIAFAGFVHDHHLAHFERLARVLLKYGGRLLIVTDRSEKIRAHLGSAENVDLHPPFARNDQVLDFLRKHASAFVVPWAFGDELERRYWDKTNFPSKLVEYAQLGQPMLILAPRGTAVSNWAEAKAWLGYCSEPTELEVQTFVSRLALRSGWEQMARQTRAAAQGEFDAAHIQAQFESELLFA